MIQPISRRFLGFISTLCVCSFFLGYANSFYEVNCILYDKGKKSIVVFNTVRRAKHVPYYIDSTYIIYMLLLLHILVYTCDHAFWGWIEIEALQANKRTNDKMAKE